VDSALAASHIRRRASSGAPVSSCADHPECRAIPSRSRCSGDETAGRRTTSQAGWHCRDKLLVAGRRLNGLQTKDRTSFAACVLKTSHTPKFTCKITDGAPRTVIRPLPVSCRTLRPSMPGSATSFKRSYRDVYRHSRPTQASLGRCARSVPACWKSYGSRPSGDQARTDSGASPFRWSCLASVASDGKNRQNRSAAWGSSGQSLRSQAFRRSLQPPLRHPEDRSQSPVRSSRLLPAQLIGVPMITFLFQDCTQMIHVCGRHDGMRGLNTRSHLAPRG